MIKHLQLIRRIGSNFSYFKIAFLVLIFCTSANGRMQAQTWPLIGAETQVASAASNYTSITVVETLVGEDGYITVPYLAFTEANIAKVKRFINGTWESVGGDVSDGNASHTYLFADENGKIYLNYVDLSTAGAKRLAVKTFNSTTNVWEPLGGSSDNLYLSAGSVVNSVSQLVSSHNSWMAFDSNNVPYVIYSELGTDGRPYVKKFVGNTWVVVGAGAISADKASGVGIAIDQENNIPYIVFISGTGSTGPIQMYKFGTNAWTLVPFPGAGSVNGTASGNVTATRHSSILLDADNNPIIAYFNASNSNKTTVIKFDKTSSVWSLSGVVSSRDATYINLAKSLSGDLYVGFIDQITASAGVQAAKVSKLASGATNWQLVINKLTPETNYIDEPASNLSVAISVNGKQYTAYTRTNSNSVTTPHVRIFSEEDIPPPPPPAPDVVVTTPKQMERLDRGVVAVKKGATQVYIGWRMFGTDPSDISFNIYRDGTKLNDAPITSSTNYTDNAPTANGTYTVKPLINGVEQASTKPVSVWGQNFLSIPLQIPAGGTTPSGETYTYNANDASVGDLDGDGEYEIILKWDPSNSKDNSQSGYTGNVYIDAYKLNGTRLWRIDLGRNIRAGAHYTQFMVYDFDGDGLAEVAIKTADGTVDGVGNVIGDKNADYRTSAGYVLSGPEFLTMFNGRTGAAMATKDYLPARGTVSSWGDNYGNRVDRFIGAVAYLDGARPSLVMGRGYYTRLVRAAWDWRDGQLTSRWVFDSSTSGNSAYAGQGNHQMTVGDVDGDGKDEIFNGSSAINDNGAGLWSNKRGHGDALHMSNMDPTLPGQEIWMCYEDPSSYAGLGLALLDAKTGKVLWGVPATGDIGRAMAADIDPNYPGYEMWGSTGGQVYSNKGVPISSSVPSMNFGVWWDGDLSRELLDRTQIDKWNPTNKKVDRLVTFSSLAPVSSNNTTKANPALSADILGDWREEVLLRTLDNSKLILFTTDIPTEHRIYTLMHDPQYRTAIAWQNSAYNQPPHPSFFLGTDMAAAPTPNIYMPSTGAPDVPNISHAGLSAFCQGESLVLTSSASSGNQWYKNGELITGAVNMTYEATAAGSYTVTTTNQCCTSAPSVAVVLSINDTPNATITADGPLSFTDGGSVKLSVNAGAGYTYKWIRNGSEITAATGATLTVTQSGSYSVLVSSGSCTSVSSQVDVVSLFKLPASNFKIAIAGESCKSSDNGKITITAVQDLNYVATVISGSVSTPYTFTKTLDIPNLKAGTYSLCITVEGQSAYKQCYDNLIVTEPKDLALYSSVNESNNTISLSMEGGKNYHIKLNGVQYTTSQATITLPLSAGANTLNVTTDSQCQGEIEKIVTLYNKVIVYPNPFDNTLSLKLGSEPSAKAAIEIRTMGGKSVYAKQFVNTDNNLQLELSHLESGVYLLKLSLDKSETFYKILKK